MPARLAVTVAALFLLGAGLIAAGHRTRRVDAGGRRADWLKYFVFLGILCVLLTAGWAGRPWAALLLVGLAAAGALEARRALATAGHPRALAGAAAFLLLASSFAHLLAGRAQTWFPSFALAVLLVASTDAFSQLWGKLLGAHRLCPRLSPGKTVEGFVGGLLTAVAVACAAGFMLPGLPVWKLCVLGALTAAGAVGGDLFFSLVKRRAGIKDFSSALPGHGGILDRFDSLAGAAPVYYWCRFFLSG